MTTAVGWSMRAPSATGQKEYQLLMFKNLVLIGWGSTTGTMQYKLHAFASDREAQAFAVAQTEAKERKGYQMHRMPTQSDRAESMWDETLPRYFGHRGSSVSLDKTFKILFLEGAPLAS